ncbi:NAD(P)-dependent dehydrogenase (short-subunit alcohol dehydrogenase family) [Nitrobacteraceae bacterium AZCC 2146]
MSMLDGKTALITGAAGGIGEATARRFIAEGARVCLVDLREDPLRRLAEALGPNATWCTADVSEDNSARRYVDAAVGAFGRIDLAFLNAGIAGTVARIEETPLSLFDSIMRINVRGVWLGLAALMPIMKVQSGGGNIVVTSSITGVRGSTGQGAYVASKHAVIGMMKTAAIEGATHNVRVNAICPAPVDTEMMAVVERGIAPDNRDLARSKILSGIPMGRYASTEEIASMVTFLSSAQSSYCTGTAYMIDGGGTAGPAR